MNVSLSTLKTIGLVYNFRDDDDAESIIGIEMMMMMRTMMVLFLVLRSTYMKQRIVVFSSLRKKPSF